MGWGRYYARVLRSELPVYDEVVAKQLLQFYVGDNGKLNAGAMIHNKNTSEVARLLVFSAYDAGFSTMLQCWVNSCIFAHGPKIYRVDSQVAEACEHHVLNIDFEEWAQPFDTFIVEFPDDYAKKRVAPCEQAGSELDSTLFRDTPLPTEHVPEFVAVTWQPEKRILLISVYLSSSQVWTRCLYERLDIGVKTIEDAIIQVNRSDKMEGSLAFNPQEKESCDIVIRVALNVIAFLMEFGYKSSPSNPSHYERLKRRLCKKKNPELARDLRLCPIIYEFTQDVKFKIYREETQVPSEGGGHTGVILRPHWRRKHRQHYWVNDGQGGKKRVIRTIPAVLVNRHLYGGPESGTQYRLI